MAIEWQIAKRRQTINRLANEWLKFFITGKDALTPEPVLEAQRS